MAVCLVQANDTVEWTHGSVVVCPSSLVFFFTSSSSSFSICSLTRAGGKAIGRNESKIKDSWVFKACTLKHQNEVYLWSYRLLLLEHKAASPRWKQAGLNRKDWGGGKKQITTGWWKNKCVWRAAAFNKDISIWTRQRWTHSHKRTTKRYMQSMHVSNNTPSTHTVTHFLNTPCTHTRTHARAHTHPPPATHTFHSTPSLILSSLNRRKKKPSNYRRLLSRRAQRCIY